MKLDLPFVGKSWVLNSGPRVCKVDILPAVVSPSPISTVSGRGVI